MVSLENEEVGSITLVDVENDVDDCFTKVTRDTALKRTLQHKESINVPDRVAWREGERQRGREGGVSLFQRG